MRRAENFEKVLQRFCTPQSRVLVVHVLLFLNVGIRILRASERVLF